MKKSLNQATYSCDSSALNVQAFDLFCSIGGLTYGLQQAGLMVSAGLDIDGSCRYAYENNCKASFIEADIKKISFSDISGYFNNAEYRVLVGCAPCQPFSSHTIKMKSYQSDSRWNLISQFLRTILEGMPEIISMENVPQLIEKPIYNQFKCELVNAGYSVSDGIISCADFGVPQSRSRLVMLASLFGEVDMPKPDPQKLNTVRRAIEHLAPLEHGQASEIDPLHICSRLDPINLKRIRASKPGGSWRDWPPELLPDCYKKVSGLTYGSVYGRMQWDMPAPTLTTQFYRYGTGRYGHPEQDRALSLREGAILQTFPEQYQFVPPGGKASFLTIGRQIGNAVPPALGCAIGKAIIGHLKKGTRSNV
jgi:DNA (cytosine-5)-methyltransferase 1